MDPFKSEIYINQANMASFKGLSLDSLPAKRKPLMKIVKKKT